MKEIRILSLLSADETALGAVGSPSSSFEAIVDIREVSEKSKLLGELVCFEVQERESVVLVLGQITEIETHNRWHEEPSFKSIIKRHGKLPNLSGVADNRIAKVTVQSSFLINSATEATKLANSPSTGVPVKQVRNEIMQELMKPYEGKLVCLGKAYDTEVNVPFWIKHFGVPNEGGGGEAYHTGVFGRTGSGKTTTAANLILGYSQHFQNMSILVLDPKEQFYEDNNVLPGNEKFAEQAINAGMNYKKYKVPQDISLPNDAELFSQILLKYQFVRIAFNLTTVDKQEFMAESIRDYINGRLNDSGFIIGNKTDELLKQMLQRFNTEPRYLANVYVSSAHVTRLGNRVDQMVNGTIDHRAIQIWNNVCRLFSESGNKIKLQKLIKKVVHEAGNLVVLNISGRETAASMDSLQTLYVKIIEDAIKDSGARLYSEGKHSNCLVVMDEAHRFISTDNFDEDIKYLTSSIIDAVRTTRKYGIGYMFITQTIDSLHVEIRRQIRIFAFGYGLTSGSEFNKIRDIINDDSAAKFYRSFIDPASNNKYPFMFYGPISPLSFTGTPLFLEMENLIKKYS